MVALRDPDERARMAKELAPSRLENNWLTNFTQPQNAKYDGRLLTDIAEMRNQEPAEALFDLLLEENLGISTVGLGTNPPHSIRVRVAPSGHDRLRRHPVRRVPQPAHVRLLPDSAGGVRESREASASLRGHSQDDLVPGPASRTARPGHILRDGFRADIVVFNPDTVKTHARHGDPKHYPVGIDYVIVNGQVVIDDGQNTGALPGPRPPPEVGETT